MSDYKQLAGFGVEMIFVDIQKIADTVKASVEEKSGKKFADFKAMSFRSQVVEGMNYIIKVCVGQSTYDYIWVRVSESLHGGISLISYRLDKRKDDPIEVFD